MAYDENGNGYGGNQNPNPLMPPAQRQPPPGYHYGFDWTSNQLFPDDPNDPNTPPLSGVNEGWMGVNDGTTAGGGVNGPWTGGVTGTGMNPVVPGATPNPTPQPKTYQPMAGWDANKLNNGGTTTKYNFGRFVQDQGYDPVWARTNLGSIVGAYNSKYGGNATAIGDDKINFGDGFGDIDVLNGGNYWQWGAWNDPNQQQGATTGANSLASLMGQTSTPTTAPTWTAMQQNSSAYGQSPLATAQRRPNNTLAQLFGGQ